MTPSPDAVRELCDIIQEAALDPPVYGLTRDQAKKLVQAILSAGTWTPKGAEAGPDTIPDHWPTDGVSPLGGSNAWYKDAASFVALIKAHPSAWFTYNASKYINVRIDTRDCGFVLQARDEAPLDMDRLLTAWREDKFRGAYGETVSPSPASAGTGGDEHVCSECGRPANEMERLLAERDDFIVKNGLWDKFTMLIRLTPTGARD